MDIKKIYQEDFNSPMVIDLSTVEFIDKRQNCIICIYKITSPTGKINIGQTVDVENRFYYYKKLSCKNQTKLYHSFKKYGVENHKFEIIHKCSEGELNTLEIHYIKFYDSFNTPHGMNLTSGGSNGRPSDETRARMSESQRGEKSSRYGKKGKDCPNFGKKRSEEQNKKNRERNSGINNYNYGKQSPFKGIPKSEEYKQKLRKPKRKRTLEHIKNNSDARRGAKRGEKAMFNIIQAQRKRREFELSIGYKAIKRVTSIETKKKQSDAKLGKKLTPESIVKREATRRINKEIIRQEKAMMIF